MVFPFAGPDALEAELAAIEDAVLGTGGAAANQRVQNFGARLFHALFTDEIRTVYDRSQQATAAAGEGLRIKLRVNAPDLATVPWEFLFDPRPAEFVALSRHTPIVRYLELPLGDPDLAVKPPIRVLGLIANPAGVPTLDIEREQRKLTQALQPLGDKVELVWLPGQMVQDLQAALQGGPWHVFHFVGHAAADGGSGEGVLLLADEQGNPDPLTATQLGRLLADQRTLRLVVLNACQGAKGNEQSLFSSLAASLVRRGLPAVLAILRDWSTSWSVRFGIVGLVASQLLFLRFPWKMAHLLPSLACLAVLYAVALDERPRLLVAAVAAQLLFAVVRVDVVRPDDPNEATGGRLGPTLTWGPVVQDWRCRRDHPDVHLGRQKEEVEAAWDCAAPFSDRP